MLTARLLGSLLTLLLTATCSPLSVDPPTSTVVPTLVAPATAGPSAVEIGPVPPSPAPELAAAPLPTPTEPAIPPTPEAPALGPLPPLTADAAMDQVVERAPFPPEARFLARGLRPTMGAEFDGAGYWVVSTGIMGQWRVDDQTWQVEPFDGTAQLWELQGRLDLR